MSLKEVLQTTGLSKDQLTKLLLDVPTQPDLAQLRKDAGYKTQDEIVDSIKQAFLENGIDERTMTRKSWSEYERGIASPRLSLKGWLVLCQVLKCSPDHLAQVIEVTNLQSMAKKDE
jgi:hypothetical protein